ncbi:MAG TPA: TonB-dependent receptor [Gemmatimonadaceae bacterium]|nr:TonB-dependent receptor [Gemmatimonadaceae bacterium]
MPITHRRHEVGGWRAFASISILLPVFALPLGAQQDTTPPAKRDTVQRLAPVVTITRDTARSPLEVPFAVTSTRPDSMRPGQRHVLLDETLFLIPGVNVSNRNNPTQDPRLNIRGFGARSQFGVRSVRVLRDGMPLTLPDGQTPVDYIDLESVGQVEAFRGSAAALYGNASGGVIDLQSAPPPLDPFAVEARGWGGDFGFQRWTATFGGTDRPFSYQGDINYTAQDGYRAYSRQHVTSGYGKVDWRADGTDLSLQLLGFDMPLAENPGALTRAQLDSAPTMADPFSVTKRARKTVQQYQVGVQASHAFGDRQLSAIVYGGSRDLYNPLTFAIVDLGRVSWGAGVRAILPARLFGVAQRFTAGVDAQRQDDDRKNFANCNGTPDPDLCTTPGEEQGALTLHQNEIVSSVGPYIRDELAFGDRYRLDLGVRADVVKFEVRDHFFADGHDDSGSRTMHQVSPIVGALARLTPLHSLYADVSTAFETPTATELGNKPDGSAGINPDLDPQTSTTYEVGLKGLIATRVQYDLALFDTEVRNELIPFEIPGGEGRTYFRNAGRTRRQGIEVGAGTLLGPVELGATYSYSRFRFRDFVVDTTQFAGNRIPGIPEHRLQAAATWRRANIFATLEGIAQSRVFVNDGNDAAANGYGVVNLRTGATAVFGRPWLAPYFGIQNLFDRHYVGSVAVNAAPQAGKYYEPGTGRTVYGGVTIAFGR